jgi:hypothetical protein
VFETALVGRGAAFGDLDNDGDTDVVIGNTSGPLQLLMNNVGSRNHWVGLRLTGKRDMIGARVEIIRKDGGSLWRRARSDGSYASANDPRVLVGLGSSTAPPQIRVRWPDGRTQDIGEVTVDKYTTVTEGR